MHQDFKKLGRNHGMTGANRNVRLSEIVPDSSRYRSFQNIERAYRGECGIYAVEYMQEQLELGRSVKTGIRFEVRQDFRSPPLLLNGNGIKVCRRPKWVHPPWIPRLRRHIIAASH
jgi:hypothetical protein